MKKDELLAIIQNRISGTDGRGEISIELVEAVVDTMLQIIMDTTIYGEKVSITGFGAFKTYILLSDRSPYFSIKFAMGDQWKKRARKLMAIGRPKWINTVISKEIRTDVLKKP